MTQDPQYSNYFSRWIDMLDIFRLQATLYSKKYGVHLARFTHRSSNVIYASTKEDGK